MPKSRQKKEQEVSAIGEKFAKSKAVVFMTQKGVSVKDTEALRRGLRETGGELQAIKKTLLKRAIQPRGIDVDQMNLQATVGVAFSYDDEVGAARTVYAFGKDHEGMAIVAGVLENELIPAQRVTALAQLPGKQDMRARAVGAIQAPLSGFVNVLAANLRQLVQVLAAIKTTKN